MPRPSRSRRAARWLGLLGCLLLVAAWEVSLRYSIMLRAGDGAFALYHSLVSYYVGWGDQPLREVVELNNRLPITFESLSVQNLGGGQWMVGLPLWLALLSVIVPMLLIWRRPPARVRRLRIRWIAKWGGVVACTIAGAGWYASRNWSAASQYDGNGFSVGALLDSGILTLRFYVGSTSAPLPNQGYTSVATRGGVCIGCKKGVTGDGGLGLSGPGVSALARGSRSYAVQSAGDELLLQADVPMWLIVVAAIAATGLFWFIDRRRPQPGHCRKCGYDLTGNVSGVCPECGTKVPAAARPQQRRSS